MKKLVLVMVFVLLMALFIAFNYLLWDRETKINEIKSLESANVSNNASITAQNRDIKRLENDNNSLVSDISRLEKEKEQLSQRNSLLEGEKNLNAQKITHKNDIINLLLQNVNSKLFETPVRKWVEAVAAGDYKEAYRLEYEKSGLQTKQTNLEEYTEDLKNSVKSIKIKEISLDTEKGAADAEIALKITLEVNAADGNATTSRFTQGLNEIYFILDYDAALNEFYIMEIRNK